MCAHFVLIAGTVAVVGGTGMAAALIDAADVAAAVVLVYAVDGLAVEAMEVAAAMLLVVVAIAGVVAVVVVVVVAAVGVVVVVAVVVVAAVVVAAAAVGAAAETVVVEHLLAQSLPQHVQALLV